MFKRLFYCFKALKVMIIVFILKTYFGYFQDLLLSMRFMDDPTLIELL